MLKKSDFFKLGEIRKTHGVKGEMMLASDHYMDYEAIKEYLFFNLEECLVPFRLKSYRDTSDKTLLFICHNIDTIEQASEYVGTEIFLPLADKSDIDELESPSMLIGLKVINDETEEIIGTVSDFIESTHNPLLEIETHEGKEVLLPFNEAFILGIEDSQLFVKIPEGLLNLDD